MSAWDTAASAVAALTAEESDAVTAVRSALVAKGWDNERLLRSELVATTLISKCRVDKAVKSHEKFMQTVASFELGKTAEDARRMYDPAAWPPRLREILEARCVLSAAATVATPTAAFFPTAALTNALHTCRS